MKLVGGENTILRIISIGLFRITVVCIMVIFVGACSSKKKPEYVEKPVEDLYNEAMDALEGKEYTT